MRTFVALFSGILLLLGSRGEVRAVSADDSLLRRQIGQMIVAGFRGFYATEKVTHAVQQLGVGGVIYFDRDVPSAVNRRNVRSPEQLEQLSADLQRLAAEAGHPALFIAIDQEGGRVNRLKPAYGFPTSVSAAYQGRIDRPDTTRVWAERTARSCRQAGINVDFAPCVDVNVNPACPIVGALGRSFSADPEKVVAHARIWIDALHRQGVRTSLKHFPGHGSSRADSHLGLTDITRTWERERELVPYRALIGEGYADFVMVGHLVHRGVDTLPASLSRRWVTDVLRGELGFRGVVITDDLNMGAIAEHYSLGGAVERAINAGVDMIIIGNNGPIFEPDLTSRTIDLIFRAVCEGRISRARIAEAYERIMTMKRDISQ